MLLRTAFSRCRKNSDTTVGPIGASIAGREHTALRLAETDACCAGPRAPTAKNHAVAVLEKTADFAAADLNRLAAARAEFEQRPGFRARGPRLRAGSEQIAGVQVATVD